MSPQEAVIGLARHIRDEVRPHLGEFRSRKITGTANSGDTTFAIDDVAEQAIVTFLMDAGVSVAYYSEDKGLIEFGSSPEGVLIIDPIDGTRPAMAGFEQCVVSVAWAKYTSNPTMGDVRYGCIAEIKQDDIYFAERGCGVKWFAPDGSSTDTRLLPITSLAGAPLSFEATARPFEYMGVALDEIVNTASLQGGVFLYGSTAYSLTRLVTGQLAAAVDVGNRIMQEHPQTRDRFLKVGGGRVVCLCTYDIAAAALIAQEAGAIVTDAFGRSLSRVPLLDSSEDNLVSICAASTPELHAQLLAAIARGSDELGRRLGVDYR